jgi:ferredoxin-NADP reductase
MNSSRRASTYLEKRPGRPGPPRSLLTYQDSKARIDKELLSRHLAVLQGPIYYIAGPPAMVAAMRQTLVSAGVEEDDIRTEEFGGY